MANVASLSNAQTLAIRKFLHMHLPSDLNEAAATYGIEDSYRLYMLRDRLDKVLGKVGE